MKTIMVVEDEAAIARLLKAYLEHAGFQVEIAENGLAALQNFPKTKPSLILLDLMMPVLDGWAVLDEVRKSSSCPVIILTARGDIQDRIRGLRKGADDYIPKPFDPQEVVERVRTVLRRPARLIEPELIRYGSLALNYTSHTVMLQGKPLALTPRDWDLLAFLAKHPNQVFTRGQLLDQVWGVDYQGGDRAVDVAVKRIRQVLQNWPESEGQIITMRGSGYQLHV